MDAPQQAQAKRQKGTNGLGFGKMTSLPDGPLIEEIEDDAASMAAPAVQPAEVIEPDTERERKEKEKEREKERQREREREASKQSTHGGQKRYVSTGSTSSKHGPSKLRQSIGLDEIEQIDEEEDEQDERVDERIDEGNEGTPTPTPSPDKEKANPVDTAAATFSASTSAPTPAFVFAPTAPATKTKTSTNVTDAAPAKTAFTFGAPTATSTSSSTAGTTKSAFEFSAPPVGASASAFNAAKTSGFTGGGAPQTSKTSLVSSTTDPKSQALSMDMDSLPTFAFGAEPKRGESSKTKLGPSGSNAAAKAREQPATALPTYDFTAALGNKPSSLKGKSKTTAGSGLGLGRPSAFSPETNAVAVPAPPPKAFDWSAAGMKAPTAAGGKWTCDTCMCTSDPGDKCTVCEADRPGSKAVTTTSSFTTTPLAFASPTVKSAPQAFDFAAAGMKPTGAGAGKWTCGTCMLTSDPGDKCSICEADRPGSGGGGGGAIPTPVPVPAAKTAPAAFDWSAAGMKTPAAAAGAWTCGTCMCVSSPGSTCSVCGTDK
jgi:hypothetical protein